MIRNAVRLVGPDGRRGFRDRRRLRHTRATIVVVQPPGF
jgi:hypothetical protein